MKTSVETLEGNKVRLSVEVEESEFEPAVDEAFKRIAREVRLPGFRPGKAPRKLLEARIGIGAAREEALREAVPNYYTEAVAQTELDPIAPPEIDITAGQEEGPVSFDAVVEVRPEVEVIGYQSLRVEMPSPTVSEEEIDEQVDRLRNQYGELVSVDRPAKDGDFVKIDMEGSRDGEPIEGLTVSSYSFEVGLGAVVPEVDENLRGASAGDELSFSGDDHEHDESEFDDEGHPPHGPIDFEISVLEVQEKVLPELTDEWVTEASEFETVDELREDVRERLTEARVNQAEAMLRERTAEAVAKLIDFEAPEVMISNEVQQRIQDLAMRLSAQGISLDQYLAITGQPQTQFVAELQETASQSVIVDLALRAVAKAEALEVTEDELHEEFAEAAEQLGETVEAMRTRFDQSGQIIDIRADMLKQKALTWLVERVEIVDSDGNLIDRNDLIADPADESDGTETDDGGEDTD